MEEMDRYEGFGYHRKATASASNKWTRRSVNPIPRPGDADDPGAAEEHGTLFRCHESVGQARRRRRERWRKTSRGSI